MLSTGFHRFSLCSGLAALLALLASGCSPAPVAEFRLNMYRIVKENPDVPADQKPTFDKQVQTLANVLEAAFGTPDQPYLLPDAAKETGISLDNLHRAAGPVRTDPSGAKLGLFREHCVHCHGITGDGAGPTAAYLNPYPRDYRPGVFKFKSTPTGAKPMHDDLVKIVTEGIPGTAMPSFKLLPRRRD